MGAVGHPGERQPGHVGGEIVEFLAFELGVELQGEVDEPEGGAARARHKAIDAAVVVDQQAELPVGTEVVGEPALDVGKVGRVFAGHVERAEQVARGLVSGADEVAEVAPRVAQRLAAFEVGRAAQQRAADRGAEGGGPLVGDVEHRRHLVAVPGLEAARREGQALDEVEVGEGQPFLLARADELGSVDLEAVDVHEVFVVVAAPHVVLAAQLAAGAAAGAQRDVGQGALEVAGGGGQQLELFHLFADHVVVQAAPAADHDFRVVVGGRVEDDAESAACARLECRQLDLPLLVAYAAHDEDEILFGRHLEPELSGGVGLGSRVRPFHIQGGQLDRLARAPVDHLSAQHGLLRQGGVCESEKQKKEDGCCAGQASQRGGMHGTGLRMQE